MTSFSLILGGVSCAFSSMEVSPSRAGGFHAPQTETHSLKIRLPASQSVAVLPTSGNVIRAFNSLWRGRLAARTFEALRTRLCAQALAASFSLHKGPLRLIQNFCRRFGSGKPSFLRALAQHPEKSGRSVFHGFQFSPVLCASVAHVSNMHRGASEYAEINAGKVRNVVR